jgi:hypothetical protein
VLLCKVKEGGPNGGIGEFGYVDDDNDKYAWGVQDNCVVVTKKLAAPVTEVGVDGIEKEVEWTPVAMFPMANVLLFGVFPDPPKPEKIPLIAAPGFRPPPGALGPQRKRR